MKQQHPILTIKNVSFRYDLRHEDYALSDVSLVVSKGEWLTILGENGSGKSTLARLIVGLAEPEFGSIQFNGQTMTAETKSTYWEKVGIVFQNPDNQFIGTTVQDDVAFSLENLNMNYDEMKQRVSNALKQVGMYELREKDPYQLSGGQKQRVAIAGVLALEPELMIFDEAFIMLDPKSRRRLLSELKAIQKEIGLTIISITHEPNEADLADRLLLLTAGKVIDQGDPRTVFDRNRQIQPPFAEQFRRELESRELSVSSDYMSDEELVEWLCK